MKRIVLFLVTNIAVMVVLSIVLSVLGLNRFVDESGLKVLESSEPKGAEAQTGTVVSLADWNDKTFSSLHAHEPAPTGDVVVLGKPKH